MNRNEVVEQALASGVTATIWCELPESTEYPVSLYGLATETNLVALTAEPAKAALAGWHPIGRLLTEDTFEVGVVYPSPAPPGALLEADHRDFFALLTARTRSILRGKLNGRHVAFVGVGASMNLVKSLVRCGLREVSLFDKDVVEAANLGRTGFELCDVGRPKVTALHRHLLNINPNVQVHEHHGDFLVPAVETVKDRLNGCNAVVMGTDSQAVQLRGNDVAYALGVPALYPGFYHGAAGGEIVVSVPPGPCYRCQVPSRFEGESAGDNSHDLAGETGLIFDCDHLDSVAGKLLAALLVGASSGPLAELVEHVKESSILLFKHDPDLVIEGCDYFGQLLPTDGTAFAYETLWLSPPDRNPECPVCGSAARRPMWP